MFTSKEVFLARIRYVATMVTGWLIALSASVNAKDYNIEYGDQYELCHDLVDLLKDFPHDADPVCGLPEPPEGSLLENLNWEPYDYSRQFLLDALTQGRTLTQSEKNEFWTVMEFDENQPARSSVKKAHIQFSSKHRPVPIYKVEMDRCELDSYENLLQRKVRIAPSFYVPKLDGVEMTSTAVSGLIDVFKYDGRFYSYTMSRDFVNVYEYRVSLNMAGKIRVCTLNKQ